MPSSDFDSIPINTRCNSAPALYGLNIAGAVLAAVEPTARLAFVYVSPVARLTVYWVAETYIHLMAERQVQHSELSRAEFAAVARGGCL